MGRAPPGAESVDGSAWWAMVVSQAWMLPRPGQEGARLHTWRNVVL